MERILVLEDDESIRTELCRLLRANGYEPVSEPPCELALLDINLPGESGFEVCRRLREGTDIPIIFLTARESNEDELLGFALGADDYIRKPYHSSVLLARIGRLLKRKGSPVLSAKGLCLRLSGLTVEYGDGVTELTKNEAHILACLMEKELCTREELITHLWTNSLYVECMSFRGTALMRMHWIGTCHTWWNTGEEGEKLPILSSKNMNAGKRMRAWRF